MFMLNFFCVSVLIVYTFLPLARPKKQPELCHDLGARRDHTQSLVAPTLLLKLATAAAALVLKFASPANILVLTNHTQSLVLKLATGGTSLVLKFHN